MPSPDTEEMEDALIPLSALQHYLFCPRQCALIHIEQQWAEDGATAEGRIMHERVDDGKADRRAGVRTVRGLALRSLALGVSGKADAVEFHGNGATSIPFPVEYKRGRPKAHRADEVQLCAQALCLEEMLSISVPEGALFYGMTRRRMLVEFDAELRNLTRQIAAETRAMLASGKTPPPHYFAGCKHCSLADLCQPKAMEKAISIANWLNKQISSTSLIE